MLGFRGLSLGGMVLQFSCDEDVAFGTHLCVYEWKVPS